LLVGTTLILFTTERWFSTTGAFNWPFREFRQEFASRRSFATMEGVMSGAAWAVTRPVGISWKTTTLTIRRTTHRVIERRPHWEIAVSVTHAPMAWTVKTYVLRAAMAGTRVEVRMPVPSVVHQVRARRQSVIRRGVSGKTSLLSRVNGRRTFNVWPLRDIKLAP
jgi:hypothetical protein